MTKPWLTVIEAASALDVSEDTIRRGIASGDLPHVRPSGSPRGTIRIPIDGLEAWARSRKLRRSPQVSAS